MIKNRKFQIIFVISLILVIQVWASYKPKNYCSSKLCYGLPNTACENDGSFSSICPTGIGLLKFNSTQKQFMIDQMNTYRSALALGSCVNATGDFFESAEEMSELMWDEEQAYLASLQIKTCNAHDLCKNTWYDAASESPIINGQNLYYEYTYAPNRPPLETSIENAVFAWFNEIEHAPTDVVSYVHVVPNYQIGHFLVMSHDKTVRVGCVASQATATAPDTIGILKTLNISCNYYRVPFLTLPLYQGGITCNGCGSACNWNDPGAGLCVVEPKVFEEEYRFDDAE